MNFFRHLLSSDFMPQGYCYLWQPEIVWLHAVSDTLIALAYYVIPALLIYLVRKRRALSFHWVFVMFGVFIFGCGTTHAMEVWTLWHGTYRLAGVIKAITATGSIAIAAALFSMIPKAFALPSPEGLSLEIAERLRGEQSLHEAKSDLEVRVQARTAEISKSNEQLLSEIERRIGIEEELRRTEERFRLVVESVQDYAIIVLDTSGHIVTWNIGAEQMKGYNAGEIIGQSFSLFYLPADVAAGKPEEALRSAVREGRFEEEGWRVRKNGSSLWAHVTITALRNLEGTLVGFSKITRDLTERKQAEEERQKLASVVENTADFVCIASLEGEALFVNPAGRAIVGLAGIEEVRGTNISDYVNEEERPKIETIALPTVFRNGHWEGEMLFANFRTHESIPMWQHIFFITEEGTNRRLALATVSRDLRERKRSEDKLRLAEAELARMARVTVLGELTASIVHEVNQPLTAIATNSDAGLRWLAANPPNMAKTRECLTEILQEANRVSETAQHIRGLVQKSLPRSEPISANDVIGEVIALVSGELAREQVALRVELAPDLPVVMGNRVQLQQVLLNLMANGIEAMSTIRSRPKELLILSKEADGHTVLISVCDRGLGLGAGVSDHLFDPFFTTKQGGIGLGLSISRRIVEAHGGHLRAVANRGPGATFEFTLPMATAGATA